jgi:hypothetical protein
MESAFMERLCTSYLGTANIHSYLGNISYLIMEHISMGHISPNMVNISNLGLMERFYSNLVRRLRLERYS